MTAPQNMPDAVRAAIEALQRQVDALEGDQFALTQQMRGIAERAERNAHSLDDLEETLTDITLAAHEEADAMAAAMAQRQAALDSDTTIAPAAAAAPVALASDSPDSGDEADPAPGVEPPTPEALHAWVVDHIAPLVRKTTLTGEGGGIRWCQFWWEHIDAVHRFTALYLAYRELSVDESATWLSVYLRDHLDPHLATLTSPYGPFYACSPRKHSDAVEALGTAEWPSTEQLGSQP